MGFRDPRVRACCGSSIMAAGWVMGRPVCEEPWQSGRPPGLPFYVHNRTSLGWTCPWQTATPAAAQWFPQEFSRKTVSELVTEAQDKADT